MLDSPRHDALATEVLVVGAGLAGFAVAIGFAEAGFETILCGAPEPLANGRTVALLDGSLRFLEALGLRAEIEKRGAPLRALRIIDDTGALWRAPNVEFQAGEIGLDAFGWNIENAQLLDAFAKAAAQRERLRMIASPVASYQWGGAQAFARCAKGEVVAARLVAAADGRHSPARVSADIGARLHRLPQKALTTILSHRRSHRDVSTEFHTRQGPFTLVPLPPLDGASRSSLVWVMSERDAGHLIALDDAALGAAIEKQAQSIYGEMRIAGGRGVVPLASLSASRLTAPRLALIGDAAHVLPPIGAQGLNLGLRDAAHLIEAAVETKRAGGDVGGFATLTRYEASRRGDVLMRAGAVNALNRSLIADFAPLDFLRSAGLAALSAIGPLRRFAMREGISPQNPPGAMRR